MSRSRTFRSEFIELYNEEANDIDDAATAVGMGGGRVDGRVPRAFHHLHAPLLRGRIDDAWVAG